MASVDDVLELLSDERRRYVLYLLTDGDTPNRIRVENLAERVAEIEADEDETVGEESVANVTINLQHVQLPRAAEAEFVEYDPDAGVVRLLGTPPEFEALVTLAEDMERGERTEETQ
ncbi:hypothetical protein ACFO0N_13470 [Halobium salinum]|uniref:DUF7344 domain-containing protein n=1 Tax=Halobium salinum TaxID=1364940 RepID=A0ABD5PEJ6_9EURY|nr:hypothetical protein [Halobium salinum]